MNSNKSKFFVQIIFAIIGGAIGFGISLLILNFYIYYTIQEEPLWLTGFVNGSLLAGVICGSIISVFLVRKFKK
ncbi:MAG: hypothetical protein Q7S66_02585 [bacterium]|nr:hypothetical protein [bacterium]